MAKNNDFNPVKEEKDGVKAKRMIWSTHTLDLALKGIEQGRKLIANPFYEGNTKLLKGDLVFQRTEDEVKEWIKCKNDILYFAEKYCKLMTPEGIQNIELRDYQKKYLKHLEDNRLSIYLACRQCGKCVTFLQHVDIQIDRDIIGDRIKKYFDKNYYNKDKDCYTIPLFEVYNIYDQSFKWKIQYLLYKILYKYESRNKIKERATTRWMEE